MGSAGGGGGGAGGLLEGGFDQWLHQPRNSGPQLCLNTNRAIQRDNLYFHVSGHWVSGRPTAEKVRG